MLRFRAALVWAAVCLCLTPAMWPAPAARAETESAVVGTVVDVVTGEAVSGARVGAEFTTHRTTTDRYGRYRLALPPGEYEVWVSARGFIAMSRVFQRVDPGSARTVDFSLLPERPGPAEERAIEAYVERERLRVDAAEAGPRPDGSARDAAWQSWQSLRLEENDEDVLDSPLVAGVPVTITVLISSRPVVTRTMEFEEYLKGVVAAEMPAHWPAEALKAQAVASRSYAATTNRYPQFGAQVGITTETQAWTDRRYATTTAAVEATRGIVATWQGRIARTYFFAGCRDGRTLDSEQVFRGTPIAYLRGVTCPHTAQAMRGHGVGLCQHGAMTMAGDKDRPADFGRIITHYFQGVALVGPDGAIDVDQPAVDEPADPAAAAPPAGQVAAALPPVATATTPPPLTSALPGGAAGGPPSPSMLGGEGSSPPSPLLPVGGSASSTPASGGNAPGLAASAGGSGGAGAPAAPPARSGPTAATARPSAAPPLAPPRRRYLENGSLVPAEAEVVLSWQGSGGEYDVIVLDAAGATVAEVTATRETTWNVGRLPPGTYTWQVRSRRGSEVGEWSEPWSFTVIGSPTAGIPTPGIAWTVSTLPDTSG